MKTLHENSSVQFCVLSFCLFILFMGFSRQKCWSGLPFLSPVDHILSDLSIMTRPSWVAPRAWLSFTELEEAVVRVFRLASFLWLWFQRVCLLMPSHSQCPEGDGVQQIQWESRLRYDPVHSLTLFIVIFPLLNYRKPDQIYHLTIKQLFQNILQE